MAEKKKRVRNKSTGRNYKQEYENYGSRPEQKKRRAMRNKARRMLMREGKVSKGDGKDVDHINSNPMQSVSSNLRVQSASNNRSFPRTKTAREKRRKKK